MTEQYDKKLSSFDEILVERVKLWESIVRESIFSEEVRGRFLNVIQERFGNGKPVNESTDDWIYFSINRLLNIAKDVIKNGLLGEDVMSLFENLRDDIWQFYKEINK